MQTRNDLNQKLARYSVTAKGQAAQGRSVAAYAGYAAAVGAGMALAGGADAAILYSGVQNISVNIDPAQQAVGGTNHQSAQLPLGGILPNFKALAGQYGEVFSNNVGNLAAKYVGAAGVQAGSNAHFLGIGGGFSAGASNLAAGALIGPAGVFAASIAGRVKIAVASTGGNHSGGTGGHFADGVTGIAGFKLGNGDYGWIRLRVDDLGPNQPFSTLLGGHPLQNGLGFPDKVTVIDWAVENSGAAIAAGDTTTVPEPTPLALLAAGAAGVAALRRRKARLAS